MCYVSRVSTRTTAGCKKKAIMLSPKLSHDNLHGALPLPSSCTAVAQEETNKASSQPFKHFEVVFFPLRIQAEISVLGRNKFMCAI